MSTDTAVAWSEVPFGTGVRLLGAHSSGLAALEKPAGVLSHPNKAAEEPRALLTTRYDERDQCFIWKGADGGERRVWLLHRLDSATSGIILVASDLEVAARVREAFEERRVRKRYVAIVLGHTREKQAHWRDVLDVQRAGGSVRAAARGVIPAETAMRCLRLIPGPPALTALELEPLTGRTHQLRVQCARRHLPILGDQNYGDFKRNRELARRFGTDRLFLHARDVEVKFIAGGTSVKFAVQSPLPAEFQAFLGKK